MSHLKAFVGNISTFWHLFVTVSETPKTMLCHALVHCTYLLSLNYCKHKQDNSEILFSHRSLLFNCSYIKYSHTCKQGRGSMQLQLVSTMHLYIVKIHFTECMFVETLQFCPFCTYVPSQKHARSTTRQHSFPPPSFGNFRTVLEEV